MTLPSQGYHLKDVPGKQMHLIGPLLYLETQQALVIWNTGGRKAKCLLKYLVCHCECHFLPKLLTSAMKSTF